MNSTAEFSSPSPGRRAIGLVSAICLGAVFIFSAGTKILAPRAFLSSIADYGILGGHWVLPAGTGMTALELALGVMLVLGVGRRWATKVSLPLVLLFVAMIVYAIRNGLSDCGCFGEVVQMPPTVELFVDMLLLLFVGLSLAWGEDLIPSGHRVTTVTGWSAFLLGGVLFLSGNPMLPADEKLEVPAEALASLSQADPPLDLSRGDQLLFLFSADCDHCWAFAGGVELMHRRLEGVTVHGVTFSDPASLGQFREAFQPTYPIHVLDLDRFEKLTTMYPAAIWVQGGQVSDTWSGFVPSLRELAEAGGYDYRTQAPFSGPADQAPEQPSSPFGSTIRARRQ